ncbi:hypothetical protein MMC07_000672 [Pseudocyphellaria aurata]|nr:hypothetical protein [Pseudocyphellaria aurata]
MVREHGISLCHLLLVSCAFVHVQAAYVARSDFGRMIWSTAACAGNWLYIDGGETYLKGNLSRPTILNQTLSIDLSKSWTTSSVELNTIEKPTSFATLRKSSLWLDSALNQIYSFGGEPYQIGTELSFWTLSIDGRGGGTWAKETPSESSGFSTLTRPAYGLDAFSSTAGYVLGGIATRRTSPETKYLSRSLLSLAGMTRYTFADQNWSNISSSGYSPSTWGASGAAHFVPSFGQAGILVFLGGDAPTEQEYNEYGDVPDRRMRFCVNGAQETESGFYEIFLFGGMTGPDFGPSNVDSHQVYILALPAFRWIRATNSSTVSRASQDCQVIGNRHLLSIGGYDPTASNESAIVDPWPYGLGLFDMTALEWTERYDAAAQPYVQSDQVKAFYHKNSKYPSSWSDTSLGAVFTSSSNASTTTSNSSTTTPKAGAQNTQVTRHHVSAAAIAGGVVGGIIGLLVVFAVAWLCFNRRQKQHPSAFRIDGQKSPDYFDSTTNSKDAVPYGVKPELEVTTPAELTGASNTSAPQYHELNSQIEQHMIGPSVVRAELAGLSKR